MSAGREFVDECIRIKPRDIPLQQAVSAALTAWSAETGENGFLKLCTDFDRVGRSTFESTVATLRAKWPPGGIKLAFWIPHFTSFANQISPIAQAAWCDERFRVLSVATGPFAPEHLSQLDWFIDHGFIYAADPGWLALLDFVQLMVGSEDILDASGFPSSVRRVAQPHAMREPLRTGLVHFGVGTVFDYVLSPCLSAAYLKGVDNETFTDLWPRDMLEHGSHELTIIPAGVAKLDGFVEKVRQRTQPPKDIVYHLSMWGLESSFVHRHSADIVASLLESFPDRNLVFRPYPKDLAHSDIKAIIRRFEHEPRFRLSTAASYVDEYLSAALLIHHRSTSAEVFQLATGRPVLQVTGPGDPLGNACGRLVEGFRDLPSIARSILEGQAPEIANSLLDSLLANPGTACKYILDALETIGSGGRKPEWLSLPLVSQNQPQDMKERYLRSAMKHLRMQLPARILGLDLARLFPESWTLNFAAAACLRKDGHPGILPLFGPYWLIALECAARCMELPPDPPFGTSLLPSFEEWCVDNIPEITTCLIGCFREPGVHRDRLEMVLSRLPLSPEPGALPQKLFNSGTKKDQDRRANQSSIQALAAEVAVLRLEVGISAMERSSPLEAKGHFLRAIDLNPNETGPWIGLAHAAMALGDRALLDVAFARLDTDPSGIQAANEIRARIRGFSKPQPSA